jgi:hypothetical protein
MAREYQRLLLILISVPILPTVIHFTLLPLGYAWYLATSTDYSLGSRLWMTPVFPLPFLPPAIAAWAALATILNRALKPDAPASSPGVLAVFALVCYHAYLLWFATSEGYAANKIALLSITVVCGLTGLAFVLRRRLARSQLPSPEA